MDAYILYEEMDAPYAIDAVNILSEMCEQINAENPCNEFHKVAKKDTIKFEE